ncbi:DELTA-stichotoxin-Hcr4b-like [Perca flavescens]|uniref:DELTA-stichotoxin-Hcr4b-like n=1 Tax=Perca flavescens TaxID=8167 RepID=UPI00106E1C45|nr:DELTA-stichotoxin-Hcr4b-like [Perca flavescens]
MPHRLCSVEIKNNSGCYTLANPRVFTESSHCEVSLPPMVGPYSPASALFNKHMGSATGAVGVFTYDLFNPNLNDYSHVMAIMLSVPYDRNLYSNRFAVGILDRGYICDYDLYDMMYNGYENFVRARADGSCISFQGGYAIVNASMSDSCEAVLRVDICDAGMY